MGYFKNIILNNYRNFDQFSIDFNECCNVIIGKNGSGKTNILEAISLFEKGRGFRKEKIQNLVNFYQNNNQFNIYSIFENNKIEFNINVFNSDKNLKKLAVNNSSEVQSIKHFESMFSIIHFLPEMERLFVNTPSVRRNFFDRLIFSFNKDYNTIINNYKKFVNERQLLLKNDNFDEDWLTKIENNIVKFGISIYHKRALHLKKINEILQIINNSNHFSKNFKLKIEDNFFEKNSNIIEFNKQYLLELKNRRQNDFFSGRCSIGPHRSDIYGINSEDNFNLNQLSTGQQKTIVLLIIIAQSEYLIKDINLRPIILLDEICSHLDDINRELLLYLIDNTGIQVFMTGTKKNFFSFLSTKANYCNIT